MKVIIIAAGSSTRLGNLTEEIPKRLLKINNKSILEIQIQQFKKNGISEIIIITGPHHEKFHFDNVSLINDEKSVRAQLDELEKNPKKEESK